MSLYLSAADQAIALDALNLLADERRARLTKAVEDMRVDDEVDGLAQQLVAVLDLRRCCEPDA